jgi:hypothetical protein
MVQRIFQGEKFEKRIEQRTVRNTIWDFGNTIKDIRFKVQTNWFENLKLRIVN